MKFIRKGQEPPELAEWKALSSDDWKPTYAALRGKEKAAVLEALIRDQGAICCYCERRLTEGDRHIEHLVPLNDMRRKAIDPFLDQKLTTDDLNRFVTGYLQRNQLGDYAEFFTTIRFLFQRWFAGDIRSP